MKNKFKLINGKKINPVESKIQWTSEWDDDLIWCPSQLIRHFTYDFKAYHIYARWRHDDPWTVRIITEKTQDPQSEEIWGDDLCVKYGVFLKESDPIDFVHSESIRLVEKYFEDKRNECPGIE